MTEMALSRSKAKHPAGKVATERDKITTKVANSNRKKEKKMNPNDPRVLRLAEMDREIEAQNRPVTPAEMRDLESRIDGAERERQADRRQLITDRDNRIAGEIDAKATSLMNSERIDYSAAVRRVVADGEHFAAPEEPAQSSESLADAVERRMAADPEHYATDDEGDTVGSIHGMNEGNYQAQMREAMERRGYDVD